MKNKQPAIARASRQRKSEQPAKAPVVRDSQISTLSSRVLALQRAIENPWAARPEDILEVQRTYGNRATQGLVENHVQRRSDPGKGGDVERGTQRAIQQARGSGAALDGRAGAELGQALGADFSDVKVHTDSQSDSLNRSLSARAFTLGSDIFFSQGAYNPRTSGGKHLLAHELTHVVQQGSTKNNKVQTKLKVSAVDGPGEREAQAASASIGEPGAAMDLSMSQRVQRYVDRRMSGSSPGVSSVQRTLMSAGDLKKEADDKGKTGGTYKIIVALLTKYEKIKAKEFNKRIGALDTLIDAVETWLTSGTRKKKFEPEKHTVLQRLKQEAFQERAELQQIKQNQAVAPNGPDSADEDLDVGTGSDKLKEALGRAKSSTDPAVKTAFLQEFNRDYAGALSGEVEWFQYVSMKLAYLRLKPGDEIANHVDTQHLQGIEHKLGQQVSDVNSSYSSMYKVDRRYTNKKSASVLLLLPKDGDKTKNAIITFRGTAAGIDALSKQESESQGVRADLDRKGIGYSAFELAKPTLLQFLDIAKQYNRITISGHSLGGAMAQRFYALASADVPDKLRLIVFQSAPVNLVTAREAEQNTAGTGAKSTRVQAMGDAVTVGGKAHVSGERLTYEFMGKQSRINTGKSHMQTGLADAQINEAKSPALLLKLMNKRLDDLVTNPTVKQKGANVSGARRTANAGRAFLGLFNKRKKKTGNYFQRLEREDMTGESFGEQQAEHKQKKQEAEDANRMSPEELMAMFNI